MHIEITPEYLKSQGLSETFPNRFWSKVIKTESCWIWTGGKGHSGYGQMCSKYGNKPIAAHVASWILNRGPIPNGLCVLHNCPGGDRTDCVNPDHLWLGTRKENSMDASKKGRIRHVVLSYEIAQEIRRLKKESVSTTKQLAEQFHVSSAAIYKILWNKSWTHG